MSFDKSDVYNEQVEPLIRQIREICEAHGMPFTHTCTVKADNGATYVSKSVLGTMDQGTVDPYTRLNIMVHDMPSGMVEGLIFRLIVEEAVANHLYGKQEEGDEEKQVDIPDTGASNFEAWLENELKDLDLNI